MHPLFNALGGSDRHPEQLDAVTKLLGRTQIFWRDGRDAFDIDRALRHFGAKSEARKNGELLRSVVAINIE